MLDLSVVGNNVGPGWEPWTRLQLSKHLRADDVFLDVGANTGEISKYCRSELGFKGPIISVEPNPVCVVKLLTEVPDPHVVIPAAAWHVTGELHRFQMPATADGVMNTGQGTVLCEEPWNPFSLLVPTIALSDLVEFNPTVLKMDVEGAEAFAVPGAAALLDGLRVVLLEVHADVLASLPVGFPELCGLLESHGLEKRGNSVDSAGNPSMYLFVREGIETTD